MFLSKAKRSETIRLLLTLDAAPTGTPTVTIEKQGASILTATNMTQGLSTLDWYYDYTTSGAAAVGAYEVRYTAVVDGVTRYGYDYYEVVVYETDDIKAETVLILSDTNSIQTDTTSIESKVDTSLVNQTDIEAKIDIIDTNVDTALVDIAAVPTVGEIDTELTSEHGAGNWTTGSTGSGARTIVFNIKDGSAVAVNLCKVSVHNATNDDAPVLANVETDSNGDTPNVLLDDGSYKVRLSKGGAIASEVEDVTITTSETVNLTVVNQSPTNPSDPDVCRLRIYPLTLGNADATGLTIAISSAGRLTKVEEQFISNTSGTFTEDSSTTPDSYYFDAVRGATVHVSSDDLGLDDEIVVPDQATYDIGSDTDIVTRI